MKITKRMIDLIPFVPKSLHPEQRELSPRIRKDTGHRDSPAHIRPLVRLGEWSKLVKRLSPGDLRWGTFDLDPFFCSLHNAALKSLETFAESPLLELPTPLA